MWNKHTIIINLFKLQLFSKINLSKLKSTLHKNIRYFHSLIEIKLVGTSLTKTHLTPTSPCTSEFSKQLKLKTWRTGRGVQNWKTKQPCSHLLGILALHFLSPSRSDTCEFAFSFSLPLPPMWYFDNCA